MNQSHQLATFTDFNGGLSLGNAVTIGDNEFTQLKNAVFSLNEGLKARPGAESVRLINATGDGGKPAGLIKSNGVIYMITNIGVYNLDDGTEEVTYTVTEDFTQVPTYVIQYAAKFYLVGAFDKVIELTDTAGTITQATVDADERLVATIFKDRMFFTRSANESRLYFSDIGDMATIGGTSFIDIEGNDLSPIRALVPFNDVLFIFKERSVWTLYANGSTANWTLRVGDDSRGCLGPLSAVVVANQLYFVDASGFYRTDGVSYTQLGHKIFDDFLSRQNYLNEVYLFEYRGNILLQCRFLNDNNNKIFFYDIEREAFAEWDFYLDDHYPVAASASGVNYNPEGPLHFKFFNGFYYFTYKPNLPAEDEVAILRLNEYITHDFPFTTTNFNEPVDYYIEFTTKLYDMGSPIGMKRGMFGFIEVLADNINYEFYTEANDVTDLTAATAIDALTDDQVAAANDANISTFHKLTIPSTWRRIGLHFRMKATNYEKTVSSGYHVEGIESAFLMWGVVFVPSAYRIDDGFI